MKLYNPLKASSMLVGGISFVILLLLASVLFSVLLVKFPIVLGTALIIALAYKPIKYIFTGKE